MFLVRTTASDETEFSVRVEIKSLKALTVAIAVAGVACAVLYLRLCYLGVGGGRSQTGVRSSGGAQAVESGRV